MPQTTRRPSGRHSAPAVVRTRMLPFGKKNAADAAPGRRRHAATTAVVVAQKADAIRPARPAGSRRPFISVAIACIGLVSSFVITPAAANAAEVSSALAPAFPAGPAQTIVVATTAGTAAVLRDGYEITETPKTPVFVMGASTNADWAALVLVDGGWPTSQNNITALLQWMDSENPPESWWNRNNPLNNGSGSGGGAGFGSYDDLVVAAKFAASNLAENSLYSKVAAALAASAPVETTVAAIQASPWASSHYGYGSLWHAVDVPIVAAPESAW